MHHGVADDLAHVTASGRRDGGLMTRRYVLLAAAPEEADLLALVQRWLRERGAVPAPNVRVVADPVRQITFARIEFGLSNGLSELKEDLQRIAEFWPLEAWRLQVQQRPRILVSAGGDDRRLHGVLALHQQGRLDGDVVAVVSQHQAVQALAEVYDVPFVHLDRDDEVPSDGDLMHFATQTAAHLVVMTQSMQILSTQGIGHESGGVEGLLSAPVPLQVSPGVYLSDVSALRTAVRWHERGELFTWRGEMVHVAP
ncbi:hypothetical protein JNUCC0626_32155 [Lentzea sp. JNUCC 0626]|uniref:hypothetical protein n=1 Tax=Lentzea sp. JNUCC 0626 TaxID=3367513 RepID=UPI003749AC71